MMLQQIMFRQRLSSPYWTHYERRRNTMNESGWFLQQLQVIFLQQWHEVLQHKLAECDHCNIQVVHSCSQLSSRYGAAIPTRRYAACRCILSPSSAVDIFVCPGSSDTRRSTIGDRAFAVAGPRAWNSLPQFVTDCLSPGTFRKHLKTYLFSLSF